MTAAMTLLLIAALCWTIGWALMLRAERAGDDDVGGFICGAVLFFLGVMLALVALLRAGAVL